ncbi:hypothetical protein AB3S75_031234 [Citrus x aurantiifolia]
MVFGVPHQLLSLTLPEAPSRFWLASAASLSLTLPETPLRLPACLTSFSLSHASGLPHQLLSPSRFQIPHGFRRASPTYLSLTLRLASPASLSLTLPDPSRLDLFKKQCGWLLAIIQSLLIIASRKHYTVDVVVAWYTVNLVVFFIDKKLLELPDRTSRNLPLLLPVSGKDKEARTNEENHKLLNGNPVDSADWRQRTQVNGKFFFGLKFFNEEAAG